MTLPLMTPDRYLGWVPFAVRAGKRIIREQGIEILYSSAPPWSTHLVGLKLKRSSSLPWVADFRDPWVDADFRPNRRGETWVGRRHRRLEREVVETADRVILNTGRARDAIRSRYAGLPKRKFAVIPNGYDPADFDFVAQAASLCSAAHVSPAAHGPSFSAEIGAVPHLAPPCEGGELRDRTNAVTTNPLVLAHAGAFYGRRSLATFLEALGNVCRRGEVPAEGIRVHLIGARRPSRTVELDQVRRAGLEGVVEVLPAVPHDECLRRLAAADVLLLVQTEAPLCVPGKVFEYIALGRPIFTLAGEGATAEMVREERLGPCVHPEDVAAIEGPLVELYRSFAAGDPLPRPSDQTCERYDGRRLTGELDELLRSVAGGSNSTAGHEAAPASELERATT